MKNRVWCVLLSITLRAVVGCHAGGYIRVQQNGTTTVTCIVAFRTAEHNNEMVQATMDTCKAAIGTQK